MAVLMFSPNSDRVSEAVAIVEALSAWIAEQPVQRQRPLKVDFIIENDRLSAITTAPLMELVK